MAEKEFQRTFMRQWREHRRKKLAEVAEELHITHGFLSKVERGKKQYTQELLEGLARVYHCRVSDLLEREPSKPVKFWSVVSRATPAQLHQIEIIAEALIGDDAEE